MFDVGFSELLVIAVVALLVLGPERLPKAARFAGLWVRRARAQWNSVKAEFERDLADDELRRTLRETQDSLRDAQASLREAGSSLRRDFETASDELMRGPVPPAAPLARQPAALPVATVEDAPALPAAPVATPAAGAGAATPDLFDPDPEQSMHAPMPEPPEPADEDGDHDAAQGEPDAPQR
ncbi:MAG TPA: Sec-independent protein translocase protein TatB [Luteimonas sp.]|jgi:sec-independent protein translocase protein TatB|nr:Sec-independent protein translocase protein TatB [Luteimonas sp.]